jgi:hypothetical protein
MWNRILPIVRAQLGGEWYAERGARLPIAPVLFQLTISAVLCALARDLLPAYPYAVFALAVPLGLGALALFGELAPLLRADVAAEWIGAQPVRPAELRLARLIVLSVLLGGLALGALLPAAVLAPAGFGILPRVGLVVVGLLQALALAAGLLAIQALCARRAEGLLVLLHTLTFVVVLVGFSTGLGQLRALAAVTEPGGALLLLPSIWFAALLPGGPGGAALLLGWSALVVTGVLLALAPFPPAPEARRTGTPLGLLLEPVRRLAAKVWVRPAERASFEFLWDALPAERDFVARAYPLLAVPLTFLLLGAGGDSLQARGLLAIAIFAPAIYLPVLLMHVPVTATPDARWLLDTSPLRPEDEAAGARKALALRLLLPLFVALGALAWARADLRFALTLAPVALACTLVLQRLIWRAFVSQPPLSCAPSDLGTVWNDSGSSGMLGIAIAVSLLAIGAWRTVPGPLVGFACLGLALVLELIPARSIPPPNQLEHNE